jgi:hypothetical protein
MEKLLRRERKPRKPNTLRNTLVSYPSHATQGEYKRENKIARQLENEIGCAEEKEYHAQ